MSEQSIRSRLALYSILERYLGDGSETDSWINRSRYRLTDRLDAEFPPRVEDGPEPIPEIMAEDFGLEDFVRLSNDRSSPVVIRGLWKDSEAVRSWTPRYLRELIGSHPVNVIDQSGFKDGCIIETVKTARLPFDRYLDGLRDESLYLNNSTELFVAFPELFDALETERLGPVFDCEAWATQLFVSGKNVYSPLHAALGSNFFVAIAGRKEWFFIRPEHTPYLRPVFAKPFAFMVTSMTIKGAAPDHPVRRIPHQSVVLEPGDVIYSPPWWWHEVVNHDDFMVGCAVRHRRRGWHLPFTNELWRNNALLTSVSIHPLMELHYHGSKAWSAVFGAKEAYAQSFNRFAQSIVHDGVDRAGEQKRAQAKR